MRSCFALVFICLLFNGYSQSSKPIWFEFGNTANLVKSKSVDKLLEQTETRLTHGFGLDFSLKISPLNVLRLGIVGSVERSYGAGPLAITYTTNSSTDTLSSTGFSKVQLSNFSYGITADFSISKMWLPNFDKSDIYFNGRVSRAHVFLRDQNYNPVTHKEFYRLNHLGFSWNIQFALGYKYVLIRRNFLQSIGLEFTYGNLLESTLQSRVYGTDYKEEFNPNLEAGYQSVGLRLVLGFAR